MSHFFTNLRLTNLNHMQNGLSLLFLFQVLRNFPRRGIIILSLQFIAISLTVPWYLTFYFLCIDMYSCVMDGHVSMCLE